LAEIETPLLMSICWLSCHCYRTVDWCPLYSRPQQNGISCLSVSLSHRHNFYAAVLCTVRGSLAIMCWSG